MPKRFGPEKCPIYLRVPWIGKASIGLDKNVKTAVESCYGSVTTRVVFTSKRMLPVAHKDVLPTTLKSSVVYEYSCHCDSRYVGRTSQRLQDRIKQHVPKWLQQQAKRPTRSQPGRSCKLKRSNPDCDPVIGQHLLDNEQCAANYNDKRFKILAVARNSFHLCLLEATFIKTKHPVLCKQKEFAHSAFLLTEITLYCTTLLWFCANVPFSFPRLQHLSPNCWDYKYLDFLWFFPFWRDCHWWERHKKLMAPIKSTLFKAIVIAIVKVDIYVYIHAYGRMDILW